MITLVRIITDSASDFEPEEIKQMNITSIPLSVTFGEDEYQENINLSKDLFYKLLKTDKAFPLTSQPAPYAYVDAFEDAMSKGDETVVITISSGLSGTYQCVNVAKDIAEYKDCYIVDSLTATGGQRLLVEHAVKLRDEGKTAKQISKELKLLRLRITIYACMDTLEYLYKGGRIAQTVYTLGSLVKIKPILHVTDDGHAEIPAKVVGHKRGISYMLNKLVERHPDPDFPLYVMYTHDKKAGEEFASILRKCKYEISERQIVNVGAVVGSHIGPDACGIAYVEA